MFLIVLHCFPLAIQEELHLYLSKLMCLCMLVIGSVQNTSAQAHAGQAGAMVCKAQLEMCRPAKSGMYFCRNEILHIHALKGLHFPAGPGDTSDSSW